MPVREGWRHDGPADRRAGRARGPVGPSVSRPVASISLRRRATAVGRRGKSLRSPAVPARRGRPSAHASTQRRRRCRRCSPDGHAASAQPAARGAETRATSPGLVRQGPTHVLAVERGRPRLAADSMGGLGKLTWRPLEARSAGPSCFKVDGCLIGMCAHSPLIAMSSCCRLSRCEQKRARTQCEDSDHTVSRLSLLSLASPHDL